MLENTVSKMYTLQGIKEPIQVDHYPMENNGFTRVESVNFLPITELFNNIYLTQKLVAKRQANPKTKRNNVLRMEQILTHYGIDCTKDDIRQFARKTEDGLPICEDWVTKRGCNEMRQARSIFAKGWIARYRQLGIDTSWFANWIALSLEGVQVTPFNPDRNELRNITHSMRRAKDLRSGDVPHVRISIWYWSSLF